MDSSIKSLTITGTAAQDAMKPRRSTTSRKKQTTGEHDEIMSEMPTPKVLAPRYIAPIKPPVQQPVQQPIQQPVQQRIEHLPIEESSVILKPPKVQRVKLQPKIQMKPLQPNISTRKARKIHMTVANLNHRFTRAKKVREDTGAKSMEAIRDFLVGKGVIQIKSKAPEKMLRSMYSDFMLLKDQAL